MQVNNLCLTQKFTLTRKKTTSGGSRNFWFFKTPLPIKLKLKKLSSKLLSKSGRNKKGQIILRTRKSLKIHYSQIKINHNFRYLNILFVANILMIPNLRKVCSLVILSSGSITYLPSTTNHGLFELVRFKSLLMQKWKFSFLNRNLIPFLNLKSISSLILHLPKNKPVSLLELLPNDSVKFTRSPGSHSTILKMNSLKGTALIRLASGVKKVFSTYAIGSKGKTVLEEKKKSHVNKAGFYKNLGKKSIVRGVAKNPVDHPHGGRTKSIKYQRTPWGKTTKFK